MPTIDFYQTLMNQPDLILTSYIPIILGVVLILFNKLITETYEKIATSDGSAFPRFITTTRLIIGGVFFIIVGIIKLFESAI
ncbi:MAG: hypothetical protein M5R37_06245 [Melioribacteraceae bacterium]|nr:hypothetical protein [Melioribacteraceae bacterium]